MTTDAEGRSLAVVTGASSGIGLELAKQFAENGFDVIMVAEDAELPAAAREVEALGTSVEALRLDLATPGGVDRLVEHLRASGDSVNALALNAGIGAGGHFARQTDLEQELRLIDLNVRSTVHLAKHLVPGMLERGHGRVLFTSSIASTMPGTYQAVYNASKSFVQSFAEAIREELEGTGVTVTSLMPGPTETEFFERAHMEDTRIGASDSKDSAAEVAAQGFQGLMNGEEQVVAGSFMNKVQARAGRLVPDSLKAKGHAKMAEPGSAKDE